MYKTEEEFLSHYNPDEFDRFSITIDVLVISISDEESTNYRKTSEKVMSILLVKRNNFPFKDKWCLPGGFIRVDEELESAPARILENETNVKDIYLEQLYTFGGVKRDPRMRVISTTYMALVDKNRMNTELKNEAKWFNLSVNEENNLIHLTLTNGDTVITAVVKKTLREKTTDRYEFSIVENDSIAFDHPLVIVSGIERLKNKIEYTDVVFNMMPKYFTLGELQKVYEVILNKKLLDPAFRRIIANKVEETDEMKTGGGHRPSRLFKYRGGK